MADAELFAESLWNLTASDDETESGPAERDRPQRSSMIYRSDAAAMRIDALQIQDLWCYRDVSLDFDVGITVIAGPNGSGKSSLLESVFFALYGSKAGPAMDRSLSDVLRLGQDQGSVRLDFRYQGRGYSARMGLKQRGDRVVGEREGCRLTRDDGQEWVGVKDVAAAIEELFGMTADDFANCVYVRQGEIDRLIRAGEEERRSMIDRLLRLERLDRYTERAKPARTAINRHVYHLQNLSNDFGRDIAKLEEQKLDEKRAKLERDIQGKREELEKLEARISEAESKRQAIQTKLDNLKTQINQVKERQAELDRKEKQLEEAEERSAKLKDERDRLRRRYKEIEQQISEDLDALKLDRASILKSIAQAIQWDGIEILPAEHRRVSDRLDNLHGELQGAQQASQDQIQELTSRKEALSSEITQTKAQIQHLHEELEQRRKLIAQGRCPTCEQPVHEGTFEQEITTREAKLNELQSALEEKQSTLSELASHIEELQRKGKERVHELNEQHKELQTQRKKLDKLKDLTTEILKVKEQGQDRQQTRQELQTTVESTREEIADLKSKIAELKEKLGDPSQIKDDLEGAEKTLQELRDEKSSIQEAIGELQTEQGQVQSQITQLANLHESKQQTDAELAQLQSLLEELNELTTFYGSFKRELRSRNIEGLEHYVNKFFTLMDSGASYRGVQVSSDYEITVELIDGGTIRPELLSGGERALLNIALRGAIHQVLSQSTARMPIILDEPTIYLDRERVNRLQFLLEELGTRVGQVVFVSHELGLVEGADHEYRTEKTPDNTSRVERVR